MNVFRRLDEIRAQRQGRPARILTIDIERLPGIAYAFDQKTKFISYRNFIEQPRTICWAARWYGQKRVLFEAVWKDEQQMIDRSWEYFDKADAVITFNGDRFDIPHLRGQWIKAGYPPPSTFKSIDLYKVVRGKFGFISNGLDHATRELGFTGKTDHYSIELAQAAVSGDKQAQQRLRAYNAGDISLTEWLYDRLAGYIPSHPHLGKSRVVSCNQCGSKDLTEMDETYKAQLLEYVQYRCDTCGGLVRSTWNVGRKAITRSIH